MTTPELAPVAAPIVGIRLHNRTPAADEPAAERVAWLLSLEEREQRRRAAQEAVVALQRAAAATLAELPGVVERRLDEVAGIAVELGLAIAREIVGSALDKGIVDPTPTVERCLRDCVRGGSDDHLVVRLHPDDLAPVQQHLRAMPELTEETAAARFVGDPRVPRGGVLAETDAGRLRYDPREALQRVCEEVRREVSA